MLSLYYFVEGKYTIFQRPHAPRRGIMTMLNKKPLRRLEMDSVMGVRREVLAKFLAGLVLVVGVFAASSGTAYAKHGADDCVDHARHGADDGPRHR